MDSDNKSLNEVQNRFPIKLYDVINSSVSRDILSNLPPPRSFDVDDSCPVLESNKTLLKLPGWEGIPTNILVNIILSAIILFGFSLLIRKVYQTEGIIKAEYMAHEKSSDWIHFIYGKRSKNVTILLSTKQNNRENPNAYLPLILHNRSQEVMGQFIRGSNLKRKNHINYYRKANNSSDIETTRSKNQIKSITSETPTLRTESEIFRILEEDEEQQVNHLKSILFDSDVTLRTSSASQSSIKTNESEPMDTSYNPKPKPNRWQRLRHWIYKYFLIKDEDIFSRRGYDALQYLVFQRYLIYFLIALNIICLFIILPLNIYAGKLQHRPHTYYRRTTILNIRKDSPIHYVHALMTVFIVAMGIYLMRSFSHLIGQSVKNIDNTILLIENIPKQKRNPIELKEFLLKKFPKVVIKRITFVFDVNQLTSLLLNLWTSIEAKNFCRVYQRRYGKRCEVRPYCLGNIQGVCGCCCCYPKVDGFSYYAQEKKQLEQMIKMDLVTCTKNPERMAFVIFEEMSMAKQVHKYFTRQHCYCSPVSILVRRIFGHESDAFDSWQWQISYAPFCDDIEWFYITVSGWKVWLLKISMNFVIIIVFYFISTPTSALNIFKYFFRSENVIENSVIEKDPDAVSQIFWSYIPTLGYTIMTGLLPAIIKLLTTLIPYRTKSDYNHAIMYKSYLFLILMVLILPSLNINTVSQLFKTQFNANEEIRWDCLFPVENGAFFLNYVLTSAFVGNCIEVVRISEVLIYTASLLFISRSSAEYLTARQMTRFEFYFGTYYPRILLLFTLIVTFSISSPLIAPIGLFYLAVKHLVDRYLIFHVYAPTKISKRIHSKAILYVYLSLLFLLFQVYTHLAAMVFKYPSYLVGVVFILHFLFTLFGFVSDFISFS